MGRTERVRLVLTGGRDSDQEGLGRLTLQSRERLFEPDVDDVEPVRSGDVPDGAKPVDALAVGALSVTLAPIALRPVLDLVRSPAGDTDRRLLASTSVPALLVLTGALSRPTCVEDPRGRLQFATVLGEQVRRPVDLRGVRFGEDVAGIVRAALKVSYGERQLASVVRLFEGPEAGDHVERLIGAPDRPTGLAPWCGNRLQPRRPALRSPHGRGGSAPMLRWTGTRRRDTPTSPPPRTPA